MYGSALKGYANVKELLLMNTNIDVAHGERVKQTFKLSVLLKNRDL